MSETSVNLVATGTPNPEGMSEIQQYLAAAGPILASHGGEVIYRGKTGKVLDGNATGTTPLNRGGLTPLFHQC